MIVLRLLTVVIFTAVLTGCALFEDVQKLKGDVSSLKDYLTQFTPPNQCGPPGTSQAVICNYRLVVTPMKEKDMFSGHVAPNWVVEGDGICKEHESERRNHPGLADIKCTTKYEYVEYGFTILGDKPENDGKPHEFVNVANTHSLKLGQIHPVKVDVTDDKAMDPGRK
jgi:hypothetical protein